MLTRGNLQLWGTFCKETVIFITEMTFFPLLPPENEFLKMFSTINAHNKEGIYNETFRKKFMWSLWKVFLVFFASVSSGTMVI